MVLYLTIIGISVVVLSVVGILLAPITGMAIWQVILTTVILTLSVIVLDALLAVIGRRVFPKKWFENDSRFFVPDKKEINLLNKLKIRSWKDKVWELGKIGTGVSKAHIEDKNNLDYINQFIVESNYGQVIHIISVVLSYLIIFIFPFTSFKTNLIFSIPVATVSAILNLMPLMILRYNTPRLLMLKKRASAKEKS